MDSSRHRCSKCGGKLAVREETPEYLFERCEQGHVALDVDRETVDRWPGGMTAQVANREPWPEGKWVRLMPTAEADD